MVTLFGTIAALYFARTILIPLAFALILAFVLSPVVASSVAWVSAIQLVDVAEKLPLYRQTIHAKMEARRIPTEGSMGLAASSLKEIARELSEPVAPSPDPGRLLTSIAQAVEQIQELIQPKAS